MDKLISKTILIIIILKIIYVAGNPAITQYIVKGIGIIYSNRK